MCKWPKRPSLRHMSTSPVIDKSPSVFLTTSPSPQLEGNCTECANVRAEMAELKVIMENKITALEQKIDAVNQEFHDKYRVLGEAVLKAASKADKCRAEFKQYSPR